METGNKFNIDSFMNKGDSFDGRVFAENIIPIITYLRQEYDKKIEDNFNIYLTIKDQKDGCKLTFKRNDLYLEYIDSKLQKNLSYPSKFKLDINHLYECIAKKTYDSDFLFSLVLLLSEGARFRKWFLEDITNKLVSNKGKVEVDQHSPAIAFSEINKNSQPEVEAILRNISGQMGQNKVVTWLDIAKNWKSICTLINNLEDEKTKTEVSNVLVRLKVRS